MRHTTHNALRRAECDIPAGAQVLHTYGDLADAQLLQTYGFIDAPPPSGAAASASGNPHNYVVVALRELLAAVQVTAAAAKLWPQGKKGAKEVQKVRGRNSGGRWAAAAVHAVLQLLLAPQRAQPLTRLLQH